MRKRYVNGMLLTLDDTIESINFFKVSLKKNIKTKWEIDGKIQPLTQSYRIIYDTTTNQVNVYYKDGCLTRDIVNNKYITILDPKQKISLLGKVEPDETFTINGIEYIKTALPTETVSVFLVHENSEKGVTENKIVTKDNKLYFGLVDSIYKNWTLNEYKEFIESSGHLYLNVIDESKFNISNIYSSFFDNSISNYIDPSITGLKDEFYMNDSSVTADFIRQIRDIFPMIQFYTREEDKNSTKYNEWINYKIFPSTLKSPLFSSHVWYRPTFGRVWQTTIEFEMEYASNDLPTLLSRRDDYRTGGFLNRWQDFKYLMKDSSNQNLDINYNVFWDRDTLESEYQKVSAQDEVGYSQFTYKYRGRILYTNIEHSARPVNLVDTILYTILYVPPKVDIDKYIDQLGMPSDAIDFRSFMIMYQQLATEIRIQSGIDIFYTEDNTALNINNYNVKNIEEAIAQLDLLYNNLVQLIDIQNERSNYVEVATLTKVQKLLENYKALITSTQGSNVDIEVVDEPPIGDNEVVMDFETKDEESKQELGVIL